MMWTAVSRVSLGVCVACVALLSVVVGCWGTVRCWRMLFWLLVSFVCEAMKERSMMSCVRVRVSRAALRR
jgi:hypothetical protein